MIDNTARFRQTLLGYRGAFAVQKKNIINFVSQSTNQGIKKNPRDFFGTWHEYASSGHIRGQYPISGSSRRCEAAGEKSLAPAIALAALLKDQNFRSETLRAQGLGSVFGRRRARSPRRHNTGSMVGAINAKRYQLHRLMKELQKENIIRHNVIGQESGEASENLIAHDVRSSTKRRLHVFQFGISKARRILAKWINWLRGDPVDILAEVVARSVNPLAMPESSVWLQPRCLIVEIILI
ncbi:hypothetical protein EVAR_2456_1 [Eumeta japonica]|uniref:Uncharacterized protein n=1 Tax=Eumeta variegata TaxID=151549 RepID=A0A4C1SQX6_EUMVA|nr:hypothetical protein EVAR_2456_1 [Eumeta japonica]